MPDADGHWVGVLGLSTTTRPEHPDARGKKVVSDRLTASLAEPFVGVRTSAGVTEGLFPIRATGFSTEPIRKAAPSSRR
jgi:hypothetical protein